MSNCMCPFLASSVRVTIFSTVSFSGVFNFLISFGILAFDISSFACRNCVKEENFEYARWLVNWW